MGADDVGMGSDVSRRLLSNVDEPITSMAPVALRFGGGAPRFIGPANTVTVDTDSNGLKNLIRVK